MTPKDKAKELVENFENALTIKDCALIAVDEIITELTEEISPSIHGFRHTYWKEVKQEIRKI